MENVPIFQLHKNCAVKQVLWTSFCLLYSLIQWLRLYTGIRENHLSQIKHVTEDQLCLWLCQNISLLEVLKCQVEVMTHSMLEVTLVQQRKQQCLFFFNPINILLDNKLFIFNSNFRMRRMRHIQISVILRSYRTCPEKQMPMHFLKMYPTHQQILSIWSLLSW